MSCVKSIIFTSLTFITLLFLINSGLRIHVGKAFDNGGAFYVEEIVNPVGKLIHGSLSGGSKMFGGRKLMEERGEIVKREASVNGGLPKQGGSHPSMVDKEVAGFMAFTADYRAPRHHPPKNN